MMYVGLDGEMSSADLESGGALIMIGLSVQTDQGFETFESLLNPGECVWQDAAKAVNTLTPEQIAAAPSAAEVDAAAAAWLVERGGKPKRRRLVPVGYNVGAFDMPFVRKYLPATAGMFTRRALDLNALVYLESMRRGITFEQAKDLLNSQALPASGNPHEAGYDAEQGLRVLSNTL